jgi:membrane protein implicated in regulation of membrane protease activity
MDWWMWLAAGFVLLVFELVTPSGFFIMFFGVGAVVVGLLSGAGLVATPWVQWLVFTAVSVACLLLFRGKIQARVEASGARPPVDSLVGEVVIPVEGIAPGAVGRVSLRGSTWEARNDGTVGVYANQRCKVVRVSGLQVGIVAE